MELTGNVLCVVQATTCSTFEVQIFVLSLVFLHEFRQARLLSLELLTHKYCHAITSNVDYMKATCLNKIS